MWPRLRRGLRISALALFGILLLAEIGLRVAGVDLEPPPLRFLFANRLHANADAEESALRRSPTVFWEPRPGARLPWSEERINASGLRGPDIPRLPEESEFRIAVLGDSCTYGSGVAYEETYGARLEVFLRAAYPDRGVRVINGGVPGYTLFQGARFFEERVLPFGPNGVVLYYGVWNEFGPAMGATDVEIAAQAGRPETRSEVLYRWLRHARVVELVAMRYASAIRYRHRRNRVDAWLVGDPPDGYRVPLEGFRELAAGFLERCAELGLRVLVVLPELDRALNEDQPVQLERLERYRAVLRELAADHGHPTVDMRVLFADRPHSELFRDPVHPGAEGHLRLAQEIRRCIAEEEWLARP